MTYPLGSSQTVRRDLPVVVGHDVVPGHRDTAPDRRARLRTRDPQWSAGLRVPGLDRGLVDVVDDAVRQRDVATLCGYAGERYSPQLFTGLRVERVQDAGIADDVERLPVRGGPHDVAARGPETHEQPTVPGSRHRVGIEDVQHAGLLRGGAHQASGGVAPQRGSDTEVD